MSRPEIDAITRGRYRTIVVLSGMPPGSKASSCQRQQSTGPSLDKTEVMIPMRDGRKLHTEIYVPRNPKEPLSFLPDPHSLWSF